MDNGAHEWVGKALLSTPLNQTNMDKEIKLKWIDALQKLIHQYTKEITNGNNYHDTIDCPLCELAESLDDDGDGCVQCIHLDPTIGQNKPCFNQASFHSNTHIKWMPYRRSYIIKLRNKLIESL